jgi:hypothetical protein
MTSVSLTSIQRIHIILPPLPAIVLFASRPISFKINLTVSPKSEPPRHSKAINRSRASINRTILIHYLMSSFLDESMESWKD